MPELATLAWDIVLRTAVVYLVILIGLRLAGKREIGQMTILTWWCCCCWPTPCRTLWSVRIRR